MKRIAVRTSLVRDDYLELIMQFPLAPIRNRKQLDSAYKVLDPLAIRGTVPGDLSRGEQDYLDVLVDLIEQYEVVAFPIESRFKDGVDALNYLMEQSGMTASDLGRLLGNRSVGGAILRREREMSKKHIILLCDHFKVRAELFLKAKRDAA